MDRCPADLLTRGAHGKDPRQPPDATASTSALSSYPCGSARTAAESLFGPESGPSRSSFGDWDGEEE